MFIRRAERFVQECAVFLLLTIGCGGCFCIIDEPSCAKEAYGFETLMFGCSSFKMNGIHSRHGYFSSERVQHSHFCSLPSEPTNPPQSFSLSTRHTHTRMLHSYYKCMAPQSPVAQSQLARLSFACSSACFGMAPPSAAF